MDILAEAKEIIEGARRQEYGDVHESFATIASFWSAYRGIEFTSHDVCAMMILLKLARQKASWKRDSLVDICGYARLSEVLECGE